MNDDVSVSIVVPIYSAENFITELVERIEELQNVYEDAPWRVTEAIFVVDGAIDGSPEILAQLAESRAWMHVLTLGRNYGQHAATIAGILHASGDWVATIDEDLQHPPEMIPELLWTAVKDEKDVVYVRSAEDKVHMNMMRDWSSSTFKNLLSRITNNPHLASASSFRMIRGDTARAASSVCGHDTYFDVALSWFTDRFSVLKKELRDIRFIESKTSGYSFSSLLSHARKMVFSSQVKLIRLATVFGLLMATMGGIVGLSILFQYFLNPSSIPVQGWVSLMLTNLFIGGCVLVLFGITLEYLSLLVQKAHGKPSFFVADRSGDRILRSYFSKNPL